MLKTVIIQGQEKVSKGSIECCYKADHYRIKDIVKELKTIDCQFVKLEKFWNEQNGKQRKAYLYFNKR